MHDLEYLHQPDTEPIAGYRLIQPLGRGGFGEVWKCEAPGGLLKAIKFVHGGMHVLDEKPPADEELRAIQHVKSIRHPFILTMERVEVVGGELIIVMELADQSLADVLDEQHKAGQPGIPRDKLLRYLREAAEVLDVMHTQHGLQHLDVKPRNLFLVSNHVKVGDFGLVNSLSGGPGAGPATLTASAITPLYAAPEVFQGNISPHCDQYSLAIVYQELLSGQLPFTGKNSRQLMFQHLQGEPDLLPLPEFDRLLVRRALSRDPKERFPSCTDFIEALIHEHGEVITLPTLSVPARCQRAESVRHVDNVPAQWPPTTVTQRRSGASEDTKRTPRVKTITTRRVRMPSVPPPESISGVKIIDLLSQTPVTEVWSAQASDGSPWLVKVLFGVGGSGPQDEAIAYLETLRHPILSGIQVVQHARGRLVLAMPAGERTLRDLLVELQAEGLPGIPRQRLLNYLRAVAEGLEDLSHDPGLQHLGLNPRTIVLNGEEPRLLDFGLAQLVWQPAGHSLTQLNARYSAPELQINQASHASDQYSLALIYHELFTGCFPTPGTEMLASLSRLPVMDQQIIARALDPDAHKRWASASELIIALEAASAEADAEMVLTGEPVRAAATVAVGMSARESLPGLTPPGSPAKPPQSMQARLGTNLSAEVIRERLEGFRVQWNAELVSTDASRLVFAVQTPRNLWQRWTGQHPGLVLSLEFLPPDISVPTGVQVRTEVHLELRPREGQTEQSEELLQAVGPQLIESLRTHLRVNPRGREEERVVWRYPLQLSSIEDNGSLGRPIDCQGKDISQGGIGFYLPGQLPSSWVMLHLPQTPQTPKMSVPARIVRVQSCGDGWFEVGAVLQPPHELPEEFSPVETAAQGIVSTRCGDG